MPIVSAGIEKKVMSNARKAGLMFRVGGDCCAPRSGLAVEGDLPDSRATKDKPQIGRAWL
jgi:hypothetical protein